MSEKQKKKHCHCPIYVRIILRNMTWSFRPKQQGIGEVKMKNMKSKSHPIPEWIIVNWRGHALILCFSLYLNSLSFSPSLSWKRSGPCGWRDLEQTPGRLCLAVLGRTTLLSLRVYEGPTVKYCAHHWDPIKYACSPVTWGFPVSFEYHSTPVLHHHS